MALRCEREWSSKERSRPGRAKLMKALDEVASYLRNEHPGGVVVVARRGKLGVRAIRERLGMSGVHPSFRDLGEDAAELRTGAPAAEGPARAYLTVIKNDPDAVLRALDQDRPSVEFEPRGRDPRGYGRISYGEILRERFDSQAGVK